MISEYTKQRIFDAIDVVDVLSDFLDLRKSGAHYQCCCPFHSEKTPSFSVNPRMNRWKCFVCGKSGDAIEFLMLHENKTFPEALEWLAHKYNIEIKYNKSERSEEEEAESRHRESLLAQLDFVQRFYVEQLNANTPEAVAAREYAYNRWSKEFCEEVGIGYAPKGGVLLDYAKAQCLSMPLLEELGVIGNKEGRSFAMLRERITIPIRNRWGKVIAFTARYLGSNPDIGKYMNSPTSIIYKKNECLFGIDVALRQAKLSSCFIMVEGAPDVLRLQSVGLSEAVAPLGTALTEKHLDQLRRVSKTIRFIPDSDPTKDGVAFPPGVAAVMKNGTLAMRFGFEVYVREIPRSDDDDRQEIKHDPDSYITSKEVYACLDDKHFVVWLAEKRFKVASSQDLQREAMKDIANLLILIDDTITRDMCIDSLCRIFGRQKMWHDAMRDAGRQLKDNFHEEQTDFEQKEIDLLHKYNITVRNNMYYSPSKEGGLERLSNFILRPKIHIKSKDSALRIFTIVNEYGQEEALELSQRNFGSVQTFQVAVESLGNYVWLGKPERFNRLKEYLYAIMPSASEIKILGWNPKEKFYAFADGIYADNRFLPINDMGIIEYGDKSYYLPMFSKMYENNPEVFDFERTFAYRNGNEETIRQFVERIVTVFGDGGKVGFAWLLACLFRDYIYANLTSFPLLNLFGIRSSGKTSLALSLASFFYIQNDAPKLGNTTIPAMTYMLSHIRNSALVFDEYTNLLPQKMIDILKAVWGGKADTKMNTADGSSSSTISKQIYSGVIFCGQHPPTADDALFTRSIHLAFTKTSFSVEERIRYDELRAVIKRGNAHLAMEVLSHYDLFEKSYMPMYDTVRTELKERLNDNIVEDRYIKNWAIPLTAYRVLETSIDVPYSYADMFDTFVRCLRYQCSMATKTTETADFWRMLNGLRMIGKILDGTHYVIKRTAKFTPLGKAKMIDFGTPRALLFLNWAAVQGVLSQRSSLNQMKMDISTLDNYLRTSPYFLGLKQQRFTILTASGSPDVEYKSEWGRTIKSVKCARPNALVFDYEAIKASSDIDLETFVAPEDEPDEIEPAEEA